MGVFTSELRAAHLEGAASEAQAQLSTHHHGLHGAPALAAHRAPHQSPVLLHQDLHAALKRAPSTTEAKLCRGHSKRVVTNYFTGSVYNLKNFNCRL